MRCVSGVYQVCISHGFGARLIRVSAVVSGMYQARIRYVPVVHVSLATFITCDHHADKKNISEGRFDCIHVGCAD